MAQRLTGCLPCFCEKGVWSPFNDGTNPVYFLLYGEFMASTQKTNYRQYSQRARQRTRNIDGYADNSYTGDNYTGGRANSAATGDQHNAQDWNSLQDELENLLDQVQMHQHDKFENEQNHYQEPHLQDEYIDEYIYDQHLMAQNISNSPDFAQNYSGNSLDNLNETEEAFNMPAQSRRQLQEAIHQIRSRQNEQRASRRQEARQQEPRQQQTRAPQQMPPQRHSSAVENQAGGNSTSRPRAQTRNHTRTQPIQSEDQHYQNLQFNKIGDALGEIGSRISLFERALGEQQNSGAAIADMASQMEQLCGVVEHLANNIGEQSQIKKLETQIARLVDAIPQGNDLDFSALNQRLDVLSNAFEKLQDLQTRQIELSIGSSGNGGDMSAIETGVRNIYEKIDDLELGEANLEPIEKAVRAIYDRIDTLEKTMGQPNPDIEWLSRDMADFTKAMKNGAGANNSSELIERVDALVGRIEQIEIQGGAVGSLKSEMENLQTSLLNVMEPRFEALEQKLGNLSTKQTKAAKNTAPNSSSPDISVDMLEKHIKALAGKIDKTNSQLNGLQQVFSDNGKNNSAPDFDSIAEMVAARTSQAVEKLQSKADNNADQTSIQQNALEQMESRLSSLFEKQTMQNRPEDFSGVQKNIEQVNKRLARLEETLSDQGDDLPDSEFDTGYSEQKVAAPLVTKEALVTTEAFAPKQVWGGDGR